MKRTRVIVAALALLLCCTAYTAQAKVSKKQYSAYEAALLDIIRKANVPSIQLVYVTAEDSLSFTVVNKDFYAATTLPQEDYPITDQSVYEACSISKIPLSWIAVKMIEEGSLELDRPLVEYYPGLLDFFATDADKEMAKVLTPRLCMIHRTGLPNKGYKEMKFLCTPDTRYGYSGPGIYCLQRTIEYLKGETLTGIARKYIFDPLDIKNTNYQWRDGYEKLHVNGYKASSITKNKWKANHPNAAFSMTTSAAECTAFFRAMMRHWGMSEASYDMMFAAYADPVPSDFPERGSFYRALGLCREDSEQFGTMYYHFGNNGNFKGLAMFIPQTQTSLVYFINGINPYNITDAIQQLFLGNEQPFAMVKAGKPLE